MYKRQIGIQNEDGLLILTLRRPEKANSLTKAMLEDMDATLAKTQARAVILTGEGKVFSAGADLDAVSYTHLDVYKRQVRAGGGCWRRGRSWGGNA